MEHKFMTFEMALLAMQAAQYVKAREGYHVTSSIKCSVRSIMLTIFTNNTYAAELPDGFLFSKREIKSLGVCGNAEMFNTTYYFNY